MAQKPEIQYVGQFYVHGSEAKKLAQEEQLKKKQERRQEKAEYTLPMVRTYAIRKLYVDPLAICGLVLAVVMLVGMVAGTVGMQTAWQEMKQVSEVVAELEQEHARLLETYRSGYDLEEIRARALEMGMVSAEELPVISISVSIPQPDPGPSQWDNFLWFLQGLFA